MREYNFIENYKNYVEDLSNRVSEYRISIEGFRNWLTENSLTEQFRKEIANHENGLCDIAYDYGIPVTMVKYLSR